VALSIQLFDASDDERKGEVRARHPESTKLYLQMKCSVTDDGKLIASDKKRKEALNIVTGVGVGIRGKRGKFQPSDDQGATSLQSHHLAYSTHHGDLERHSKNYYLEGMNKNGPNDDGTYLSSTDAEGWSSYALPVDVMTVDYLNFWITNEPDDEANGVFQDEHLAPAGLGSIDTIDTVSGLLSAVIDPDPCIY
jgi:hypothetical protein